ncbi:I78 family peptidase inhibitor [Sphingomonas sp.]|jgi:hypothetical protein|uniref:I78 family peptidase inhibitor n=1 Tax=Sphingomonas sp. TaxID=28214 RepID=UPI002EDB52A7
MSFRLFLPILAIAACADNAGNVSENRSNQDSALVSRPADAPPSDVNDVIGATPGPCGSTRATAFLGKTYHPELDAELMRVSGATAIRRIRPTGEDAAEGPIVDRRMNVVLNDSGQIIMLDCG